MTITYATYTCATCEHAWEAVIHEDPGTRESPPSDDAPSACPICESEDIHEDGRDDYPADAPDCSEEE